MSIDLDAIRARANAANTAWLPRWVAFDVRSLISEVVHLQGIVKEQSAKDTQRTARHIEEVIEQQRLTVKARNDTRALEAENAALRAEIVAWLRADAARTSPGPVSPMRRIEQAYALKVAGIIERGEHRREEK